MRKKATNPLDQETLARFKMVEPISRKHAAPLHPNPVRRFREELRLARPAFAKMIETPVDTLKEWEREREPVIPGTSRLMRMIQIARESQYPLLIDDIWKYAEKHSTRPANQPPKG
jgi:DNA-binding transcriptional regulator YiaG